MLSTEHSASCHGKPGIASPMLMPIPVRNTACVLTIVADVGLASDILLLSGTCRSGQIHRSNARARAVRQAVPASAPALLERQVRTRSISTHACRTYESGLGPG